MVDKSENPTKANHIYLIYIHIYMYKQNLALNNRQQLNCGKIRPKKSIKYIQVTSLFLVMLCEYIVVSRDFRFIQDESFWDMQPSLHIYYFAQVAYHLDVKSLSFCTVQKSEKTMARTLYIKEFLWISLCSA